MGKRMKKGAKIVGEANDSPVSTALLRASKPFGAGDRSIPRSKDRNSPIPTDDVGIDTAGVKAHADAPASAPSTLVHPSLPAVNRKPHARSVSAENVAYQEQYSRATAMSSAELGKAIKGPTKRITKHLGLAIAHEEKAKTARDQAQTEFKENIGYYYETKERLLNPGYRTDVDGGKDRTPDENQKNFGAPDWATFNAQCNAYSLQHADRLLKQYAKSNDLLTDDGENIDDPETEEVAPARPSRRSTNDITAQKRYEHIATAAMSIASSNPKGEVEKQILAAAEFIPAPVTPLQPDIYTEVLSFVTTIAKLAPNESVKAEAKRLLGKLLLFRPKPDPARILADATAEEKRKRDRRLAKKNGRPLGTSEHVQRLELSPCAGPEVVQANVNSGPEPGPEPPAKVLANAPWARRRLNLGEDHEMATPVLSEHSEVDRVIPELPNEVSSAPAQNLVNDNSTAPLPDSAAQTLRPPATMTCTQLVPGKKYQVRPAPSGGYGIYEPRSTILLQLFTEEDDARDAINSVIPTTTCPKCGKVTVKVIKIAGATRYWHELEGRQRKHRGCIVMEREPVVVDKDAENAAKIEAWHDRTTKGREKGQAAAKAKIAAPPEPPITTVELTPQEVAWLRRNMQFAKTYKGGETQLTEKGFVIYTKNLMTSRLPHHIPGVLSSKITARNINTVLSIVHKIEATTGVVTSASAPTAVTVHAPDPTPDPPREDETDNYTPTIHTDDGGCSKCHHGHSCSKCGWDYCDCIPCDCPDCPTIKKNKSWSQQESQYW